MSSSRREVNARTRRSIANCINCLCALTAASRHALHHKPVEVLLDTTACHLESDLHTCRQWCGPDRLLQSGNSTLSICLRRAACRCWGLTNPLECGLSRRRHQYRSELDVWQVLVHLLKGKHSYCRVGRLEDASGNGQAARHVVFENGVAPSHELPNAAGQTPPRARTRATAVLDDETLGILPSDNQGAFELHVAGQLWRSLSLSTTSSTGIHSRPQQHRRIGNRFLGFSLPSRLPSLPQLPRQRLAVSACRYQHVNVKPSRARRYRLGLHPGMPATWSEI
jgi:hypothetical protein